MSSVLVQLHEACDLHQSWNPLESLDPYIVVRTGTVKKTSKTVSNGGKNCRFDEGLLLNYKPGNSIRFVVKDERLVLLDKVVGFGVVHADTFKNGRADVIVPLVRDELKEAGFLRVTIYLNE